MLPRNDKGGWRVRSARGSPQGGDVKRSVKSTSAFQAPPPAEDISGYSLLCVS